MQCSKCNNTIGDNLITCPHCNADLNKLSTLDVFMQNIELINTIHNGKDAIVLPQDDICADVRDNFEVSYDEKVLFLRDRSFWNSRNQGLVITDQKIYLLPDNDKPDELYYINWGEVEKVDYKDLNLYFFLGDSEKTTVYLENFVKDTTLYEVEEIVVIGKDLASLFSKMALQAEAYTSELDLSIEHFYNLIEQDKINEALAFAHRCKEDEIDGEIFFYLIAEYFLEQKKYEELIEICNQGLQHPNLSYDSKTCLLYFRSIAYSKKGHIDLARKDTFNVSKREIDSILECKQKAIENFQQLEKNYNELFLQLPYNKRKTIIVTAEYHDLSQNNLNVFSINHLPPIDFPIGHPVINQLYVAHPCIKDKYIPFENYELELIEDKVREFCLLAQSLGATEIKIESLKNSSIDNEAKVDSKVNGAASLKLASANASKEINSNNSLLNEISQSINLQQKFTPSGKPFLPKGLVWFDNEPSWQRLFHQRINGNITQHEERIETKKSRIINNNELTCIQAEVKNLILAGNGKWSKSMENSFKAKENSILTIHVSFSSSNNNSQIPLIKSPLEQDNEYLEILESCLPPSAEISDTERKLLDRLQTFIGISKERAHELEEQRNKPKLSPEEIEYLEEYKYCLDNGNEITPVERRLLDRLKSKLGISNERVAEIERHLL